MRKFSEIINEQESRKDYKYTATVKVEGIVTAASEGEAGELVDKEMDTIPGMINYQINLISDANPVGEKKINENLAPTSFPATYYIVANGGHLNEPRIEKITITKEMMDEMMENESDVDDAFNQIIYDAQAEYSQMFAQSVAFSEEMFNKLKNIISTESYFEVEKNKYASLKNISSEKLSFKEFNEYVKDYVANPGEYNIDTDSEYYEALVSAARNPHTVYAEYEKLFK